MTAFSQTFVAWVLLASRQDLVRSSAASPASGDLSNRIASFTAKLPFRYSIVAPTPAQAATCLHNGMSCTIGTQCCSLIYNPIAQRCVGGLALLPAGQRLPIHPNP